MTQLSIEGNVKRVVRDIGVTCPKLIRASTVTALTRTNNKVFTAAKREIRDTTGIPLKHYKRKLRKYPASRRRLLARTWMGLRNAQIPLSGLTRARRPSQAKWEDKVSASLGGKPFSSAFEATVKNAHRGYFVRKDKADFSTGVDSKGRPRRGRLPIQQLVINIAADARRAIENAGDKVVPREFPTEFAREVRRRLLKINTT